jgi:hypothetical protein
MSDTGMTPTIVAWKVWLIKARRAFNHETTIILTILTAIMRPVFWLDQLKQVFLFR